MENKTKTYFEKETRDNTMKLRELRKALPEWTHSFFIAIEPTTASRTRIAYAVDLKVFFEFIKQASSIYRDTPIDQLPITLLTQLNSTDIEEYLEYLKLYRDSNGNEISNNERGLKRKLASLRTFYHYFHKNKFINENPVAQVDMPKIHEKAIIRLDVDEVADLLDRVESGDGLTKNQLARHKHYKLRDLALMTLMLGTGIRVSECVGIDMKHIDFNNDRIKIVRKGGYESYVYFGKEVRKCLLSYLSFREQQECKGEDNDAFFLSSRMKRISVRNVEILVKKYAQLVTQMKKITPHKLRSTYGTSLYRETGDIYLVADVLGHKDVNTTRKHYAAVEEEKRRMAKDAVTLREKKD